MKVMRQAVGGSGLPRADLARTGLQRCLCAPCWESNACDQPKQCSGHGKCSVTQGCVCTYGYVGDHCEQPPGARKRLHHLLRAH